MFFMDYVSVFLSCLIVVVVISILLKVIRFIGLILVILCVLILYRLCVDKKRFLFIFLVMIRIFLSLSFLSLVISFLVFGVLRLNCLIMIKCFWWINLDKMFLIVLWYILWFIFWLWFCGLVVKLMLFEC